MEFYFFFGGIQLVHSSFLGQSAGNSEAKIMKL